MKTTFLKTLSLLGVTALMAVNASAQEPKEKFNHHEYKYKSGDYKVKEQKDESKYKGSAYKEKVNSNERKVKKLVRPMRPTSSEETTIITGETRVTATEPSRTTIEQVTMNAAQDEAVTKTKSVRKSTTRHYAAHRSPARKHYAVRKTKSTHKYAAVRTKIVKEPIVTTRTEYVHDTVFVTRVDTVMKIQRMNTYAGYRIPRGDFKKVKLKRDKEGRVWMKRKE